MNIFQLVAGMCLFMGLSACGVEGPVEANTDDDGGSGASSAGGGPSAEGGAGQGAGSSGGGPSGTGGGSSPTCYTEPLTPDADVSDIVSSYGGSGYKDDVIEAMSRRWPAGAYLLTQQKNDAYFSQFSDPSSWNGMVGWLDTLVHEETHLFNAYHAIAQGEEHALFFREDLIVYLPEDQSFPRSEILDDLASGPAGGIYSNTYFTGQSGTRGFNALLDEANCYANEVPAMSSFGEYYNGGVSLRDGSAAFLYFIQVYLRVARTEFPDFYAYAQSTPAYVDAVRILWLRTHFFYQHADTFPNLGISDGMYRAEAYKSDNLAEIQAFIGHAVDDSNCLVD